MTSLEPSSPECREPCSMGLRGQGGGGGVTCLQSDMNISHFDSSWQEKQPSNLCISSFQYNEAFHKLSIPGLNYKGQIAILLTKINSSSLINLALCNLPYLVDSPQ